MGQPLEPLCQHGRGIGGPGHFPASVEEKLQGACDKAACELEAAEIGDRDRAKHLDRSLVDRLLECIHQMIEDGVDRMKTSAGDMPIIVVGGGAFLVPHKLAGVSEVVHVEHASNRSAG
ncbi:hypothetical protein [Microvirga makkahensis]|nr:hypothetical protein [Microvirga makkahensis]